MLRNYLKIALRNLRRHKGYTAINVGGLAMGLAACLLIGLWVQQQLSYDDFHEEADRTYRLTSYYKLSADHEGSTYTLSPSALAGALERDVPQVEQAVRVARSPHVIQRGDEAFAESALYHADTDFFEAFSFPLLKGAPRQVLERPGSLVLTQRAAGKYFPNDLAPVGQTLRVDGEMHTITGVAADLPANTHFDFDMVASMPQEKPRWYRNNVVTYVRLAVGARPESLQTTLTELVNTRKGATDDPDREYAMYLQPITGIHLGQGLPLGVELTGRDVSYAFGGTGSASYVYLFSALAIFILLIACVNFTNLATARQAERAKEVGMRKALGARRGALAGLFLSEAVLAALAALAVAIGVARLALPALNALVDTPLSLNALWSGPGVLLALGTTLVAGLLAGGYPALVLSRPRPADALRGRPSGPGGERLRQTLVVFQFAASVALVAGTAVIYQQLGYLQDKDLGFEKEQALLIQLDEHTIRKGAPPLPKQALSSLPGVESVALAHSIPGASFSFTNYQTVGESTEASLYTTWGDYDYHKALGLRVKNGRGFSRSFAGDSSAMLLNETAARLLFGEEDPIGEQITPAGGAPYPRTVVGVVEDFNYQSLRRKVEPLAIFFLEFPYYWPDPETMVVRLRPESAAATLAAVRHTWEEALPNAPLTYSFLDDKVDALYRSEQRAGQLFSAFAGLAILLACLGLFGLAAFAAERRRKEIGIRKVLGASVASVVALLSKDFAKLVGIAFVVAAPVAYFAMRHWLEDFAYRIDLSPWLFLAAGAAALGVALLTVSVQALRAATANPTEALRSE